MKSLLFWLFMALVPRIALSQTKIERSYPVTKGQAIEFRFDYPKRIHITTWDKNEVSVTASVQINGGKNDNAFTIAQSTVDGKISISNKLDMDQIPYSHYVIDRGIKTAFPSQADLEAYLKVNGSNVTSRYQQKEIEVEIEIKVPTGSITDVAAVYGMVEIDNFKGQINVDAKYGGIDASLSEKAIGKLKLTNKYGKIYTNMSLKPTEQTEKNFFTSITAIPGTGPSYDFSSSYGNIYLRNSEK